MRRWHTLALVSFVLSASIARAHQLPPRPERIAMAGDRILLSAPFGLMVSDDAGASWRWVCAAAYGLNPVRTEPDLALAGDGSVVLGDFDGAARADHDLCAFERPPGPTHDTYVIDVAVDPHAPDTIWGVASSGSEPSTIVRSEDGGRSWATVSEPVLAVLFEKIALAPSDSRRVYVSGFRPPSGDQPAHAFLLRSDDGGATLSRVEIPLTDGEHAPLVLAVDPNDADRLFVRMERVEGDERPERLLLSEDGGQTFESVIELPEMRGFAMSDDGATVFVGSAQGGGVWVARDGSVSFEQVAAVDVRCLTLDGSTLYLCADPITTDYALGRSDDGGATITPLLHMRDVRQLLSCPHCSSVSLVCPAWAPDLYSDVQRYYGAGDAGPREDSMPDAGPPPPECRPDAGTSTPPTGGGCTCRAAPSSASSPLWLGAAAAGWLLRRRRRRAGPNERGALFVAARAGASRPRTRE